MPWFLMTTAAPRRMLRSEYSASRAEMATYLDQASRAARKLTMRYDESYGAVRRWIAGHPGLAFWFGLGAVVLAFIVGWLA